jgi:hypothetical protein
MLKIMITNTTKEERWTLQGRLVVPGVEKLSASWNRTARPRGERCIAKRHKYRRPENEFKECSEGKNR